MTLTKGKLQRGAHNSKPSVKFTLFSLVLFMIQQHAHSLAAARMINLVNLALVLPSTVYLEWTRMTWKCWISKMRNYKNNLQSSQWEILSTPTFRELRTLTSDKQHNVECEAKCPLWSIDIRNQNFLKWYIIKQSNKQTTAKLAFIMWNNSCKDAYWQKAAFKLVLCKWGQLSEMHFDSSYAKSGNKCDFYAWKHISE